MENLRKKRMLLVTGCILLFVLGFWMTFILPGTLAKMEYKKAVKSMVSLQTALSEFVEEASKMRWFAESYQTNVRRYALQSQKEMDNVIATLKAADNADSKNKGRLAKEANQNLASISSILEKGRQTLADYQKKTSEGRSTLGLLEKTTADLEKKLSEIAESVKESSHNCLSKYIKEMTGQLSNAEKSIDESVVVIKNANTLLPAAESQSAQGDPIKALVILADGQKYCKNAKTFLDSVTNELAFQKEAKDKAGPSLTSAENNFDKAQTHLADISRNTSLLPQKSLKLAYAKKDEASNTLVQAKLSLNTIVENGKCDLALAYRQALHVSALSDEMVKETDRQVQNMNKAKEQISRLEASMTTLRSMLATASRSRSTLALNHAQSTWLDVSNNNSLADEKIRSAQQMLSNAVNFAREQEFDKSLGCCQNSAVLLDQSTTLIRELEKRADTLERFRQEWPNAERHAQNTINDEENYVNRYGSHSFSAQSDFNDAIRAFRIAHSLADNNEYEAAVRKANEAHELADGTGYRAKSAYDDDMEEEEQARQRAIDNDDSSPFGFGNDSGGGGYSGGSSNDGGGFGGGSSSDGGGYSGDRSNDGGGWK